MHPRVEGGSLSIFRRSWKARCKHYNGQARGNEDGLLGDGERLRLLHGPLLGRRPGTLLQERIGGRRRARVWRRTWLLRARPRGRRREGAWLRRHGEHRATDGRPRQDAGPLAARHRTQERRMADLPGGGGAHPGSVRERLSAQSQRRRASGHGALMVERDDGPRPRQPAQPPLGGAASAEAWRLDAGRGGDQAAAG